VTAFFRSALFPLIVIVLLVYLASQTLMADDPPTQQLAYAEAQRLLREHPERIDEITLRPNERTARIRLTDGTQAKTPPGKNGSSDSWLFGLAAFVIVAAIAIVLQNRSRSRDEEDLTAQVRNRSTA
jgi:hypothetical protein